MEAPACPCRGWCCSMDRGAQVFSRIISCVPQCTILCHTCSDGGPHPTLHGSDGRPASWGIPRSTICLGVHGMVGHRAGHPARTLHPVILSVPPLRGPSGDLLVHRPLPCPCLPQTQWASSLLSSLDLPRDVREDVEGGPALSWPEDSGHGI